LNKTSSLSKKLLIIAMILCFIIVALTGVLKFRELLRPFNIPYDKLPMKQVSILHDWTGIILILLIFMHFVFQININRKKSFTVGALIILVFAGVFFMINLFKPQSFSQGSENIKNLKNVEITEYQGENFSSISDFRENSIKGPQYINIKDYALNIGGLVDKKLTLTYDEVLHYDKYSKIVTLNCVEGWSVKILWEGILLKDLLKEARIKPESNTVIFYAYDGYSSSLPLDYIIDNNIILAYKMNGVTIPPERGFPFQVVAEDKWGYKWVKWVTKIELSSDSNYKGYWEKSGYNQKGDLKGPIFEE
jgi:hypothetical protein